MKEFKSGNQTIYVRAEHQHLFEAARTVALLENHGGVSVYIAGLIKADLERVRRELPSLINKLQETLK